MVISGGISAQEKQNSTALFGPDARSALMRWEKAKEKVDQAYVIELRRCLEKATRDGKLEEAVAIKAEINRLAKPATALNPPPLEEFLVGTTWTNSVNKTTVKFEANGKGLRFSGGRQSVISYEVSTQKRFSIKWSTPNVPRAKCVISTDRKSFQSGDVKWTLSP